MTAGVAVPAGGYEVWVAAAVAAGDRYRHEVARRAGMWCGFGHLVAEAVLIEAAGQWARAAEEAPVGSVEKRTARWCSTQLRDRAERHALAAHLADVAPVVEEVRS